MISLKQMLNFQRLCRFQVAIVIINARIFPSVVAEKPEMVITHGCLLHSIAYSKINVVFTQESGVRPNFNSHYILYTYPQPHHETGGIFSSGGR